MIERLHNSRFLKACRGEATDVPPVWLMRQAGRYMKEYRDIRAKTDFLGLCKTPELAAQVTLDAQRILSVDAAILFADLLPILQPMGLTLTYEEGEGPRIHNPIRGAADIDALKEENPRESMPFVGRAVKIIRRELPPDIPLIGFAGAPFTLAAYAIEGASSRNYVATKTLMLGDPGAWRALMERLTRQVSDYLQAQIDWGVQAVQIFDSWVGCLSPEDYAEHALPWVRQVISNVTGEVPVIYFGTGTATFLPMIMNVGAQRAAPSTMSDPAGGQGAQHAAPLHVPNVLGIDWHTPLEHGWKAGAKAIQGNLDPVALFAPKEVVLRKATEVLRQANQRPEGTGYIFNLGHGILPKTPVDNVKALVDHIHEAA